MHFNDVGVRGDVPADVAATGHNLGKACTCAVQLRPRRGGLEQSEQAGYQGWGGKMVKASLG